MNISTQGISLQKKFYEAFSFLTMLLLLSMTVQSQTRTYSLVYSDNLKGSSTIFGNTLLHIVKSNGDVFTTKMNDNSANGNSTYGNDDENMQYVDVDGSSGNGSVTRNSSSSDLILPDGTNEIKLARLYWGGRIANSNFDLSQDANKKVKIRKGSSSVYSDVTALGIDKATIVSGYTEYQAYADITTFIKNNGAGTYQVGNAPLSIGAISDGGNHGGWCIVVVYENSSLPYNSVRLYDGFQVVYNGGSSTTTAVTLTGLDVPSGVMAASDATMGVVAWEGDANLKGDFLRINGNIFSNTTNPKDNPWNGTITNSGFHVTTKNPNYTNQMGLDIDMFDVGSGYGITPNATSIALQFGTEADKYYPGVFTFSIKMKDPTVTLEKSVTDANSNHLAEAGEVLTYTLKGQNTGVGNANDIVLKDTLPNTVTFKPGSLKVISAPGITAGLKTDNSGDDIAEYRVNGSTKTIIFHLGTGATSSGGGVLAANETYEVQFQVTVNDPGRNNRVPSIMNIARITSQSDARVSFVDDGTAIINPEEGPMPVTLSKFTASSLQDSKVQLDWSTSMEINCAGYIVERSNDGNSFSAVANVAGNGTTSLYHNYSALDDISSVSGNAVYYRLKQMDIDGKANLSNVIALKVTKSNQLVSVSPNPFISYIIINTNWNESEEISAMIMNIQGKIVALKAVRVNKGANSIKIDNLSNLPSGNYILQLVSPNGKIIQKLMK
ncbi:MAG: T9SS type A sorting domain-containing protein [Ginsengibacter sp.]